MERSRAQAEGQSLAEYALILSLIVLVAVAALVFFGSQIDTILMVIANQINGEPPRSPARRRVHHHSSRAPVPRSYICP